MFLPAMLCLFYLSHVGLSDKLLSGSTALSKSMMEFVNKCLQGPWLYKLNSHSLHSVSHSIPESNNNWTIDHDAEYGYFHVSVGTNHRRYF